jgi:hypothetical protein
MKRYLWVLPFFLVTTYFVAFAQDQFSVRLSPGIAFGRVHTDPDTAGFSSNGISLGGKVGVMYDWNIKDSYYLSGGGAFAVQHIGIKNQAIQELHAIRLLQLPVLLKLYTSELDLDLRGYAEIGFVGALKINNRIVNLVGDQAFVTKLRMWEIGGLLGCGVEYSLSLFTSIFVGISYQLGLSSMFMDQRSDPPFSKLYGYGDVITLDMGIKF